MHKLLVTLLFVVSGCYYEVETDASDDTYVEESATPDVTPNLDGQEISFSAPIVDTARAGFWPDCRQLPYIPKFAGEWQYCIDIESNSRPYSCDSPEPPEDLSCWPMEGLWDVENGYCCCKTGSCIPN